MDHTDLPVSECLLGGDAEMLTFVLGRVRKEFAWKTGGLNATQLRRRHPPSTMTLAGLIKHVALVEDRSPQPHRDARPFWFLLTMSASGSQR